MTTHDDDESFLSRWSRRKRESNAEPESEAEESSDIVPEQAEPSPISAEQERSPSLPEDEEKPIWQQKDSDPELKRKALRELFSQAEFNHRDGLNDYDHDYTKERKLGDIVTAQMKRMIKLAEQKAQPESALSSEQDSTIASADIPVENSIHSESDEEDKRA